MSNIKRVSEMNIEELEKKYKVKAQAGKISKADGKYFLSIDGQKKELDPKQVLTSHPLENIANENGEVRVINTIHGIRIIIIPHRPPILCYIPVLDHLPVIDRNIRIQLINSMVKEKTIPAAFGKQLLKELTDK